MFIIATYPFGQFDEKQVFVIIQIFTNCKNEKHCKNSLSSDILVLLTWHILSSILHFVTTAINDQKVVNYYL